LSDGAKEENIGLLDGLGSEVNKEGRFWKEGGCHVWVMMASSNKTTFLICLQEISIVPNFTVFLHPYIVVMK
jgi:hypothetical protein